VGAKKFSDGTCKYLPCVELLIVEIMCLFVVSVCINLSYGIVGMTWRSFVL